MKSQVPSFDEAHVDSLSGASILPARLAYNLIAPEITHWYWQAFWQAYERPLICDWLDSLVGCRSICDVGCGTGQYLARMARRFVAPTGIDISEAMLGVVRDNARRSPETYKQVGLVQGNIRCLPFASGVFDALLCARVLSNVGDLQGGLSELARACRPKGRLLITDVHPEHPYSVTRARLLTRTVLVETYKHPVTAIKTCLLRAGFGQIHIREYRIADLAPQPDKRLFGKLYAQPELPVFFTLEAKNG